MTSCWMKTNVLRHGLLIATALLVATAVLIQTASAGRPPAPPPRGVAADAEKLAGIRSVVVIPFPEAFDFRVTDLNVNIGQGFIGAALDSAEKKRMAELALGLKANVHGFSSQFANSIAEQLRAEGYEGLRWRGGDVE